MDGAAGVVPFIFSADDELMFEVEAGVISPNGFAYAANRAASVSRNRTVRLFALLPDMSNISTTA